MTTFQLTQRQRGAGVVLALLALLFSAGPSLALTGFVGGEDHGCVCCGPGCHCDADCCDHEAELNGTITLGGGLVQGSSIRAVPSCFYRDDLVEACPAPLPKVVKDRATPELAASGPSRTLSPSTPLMPISREHRQGQPRGPPR